MAVRIRYAVSAAVSSTTAEERDLGNIKLECVTDQESKGGAWQTTLDDGSMDVQIYLDNIVTTQLLIIRTLSADPNVAPGSISIKRNNTAAEPIQIKPLGDIKEGIFVISTDGLTALYATNSSGVDMKLTLVVCGN